MAHWHGSWKTVWASAPAAICPVCRSALWRAATWGSSQRTRWRICKRSCASWRPRRKKRWTFQRCWSWLTLRRPCALSHRPCRSRERRCVSAWRGTGRSAFTMRTASTCCGSWVRSWYPSARWRMSGSPTAYRACTWAAVTRSCTRHSWRKTMSCAGEFGRSYTRGCPVSPSAAALCT